MVLIEFKNDSQIVLLGSAHPTKLLGAVSQHIPEAYNTLTTDLTLFECVDNGATGFVIVGAVGKLAFAPIRFQFNKAIQDFLFIQINGREIPDTR